MRCDSSEGDDCGSNGGTAVDLPHEQRGNPDGTWSSRSGPGFHLRQPRMSDLSFNERLFLSHLRWNGALPKTELARLTGLSPTAASSLIRQLETKGLVRRGRPQRGKVGQPSVPLFSTIPKAAMPLVSRSAGAALSWCSWMPRCASGFDYGAAVPHSAARCGPGLRLRINRPNAGPTSLRTSRTGSVASALPCLSTSGTGQRRWRSNRAPSMRGDRSIPAGTGWRRPACRSTSPTMRPPPAPRSTRFTLGLTRSI